MNTPNPLIPQGSLQGMPKGNSNIRIAVFTIIAIHAVFFGGLLMQGCKRDKDTTKLGGTNEQAGVASNSLPPIGGTNYYDNYNQLTQTVQRMEAPAIATTNINASERIVADLQMAPKPPTETKDYTVVRGDTLDKIARKSGVTLAALEKANPGVEPAHLKVGQKLQIPIPETAANPNTPGPVSGTNVAEVGTGNGGIHVVKPGDTLSKIAKHYGVTPKAIRAANHLKTDRITVNQKLKIPAPVHAAAHSDTSTQ